MTSQAKTETLKAFVADIAACRPERIEIIAPQSNDPGAINYRAMCEEVGLKAMPHLAVIDGAVDGPHVLKSGRRGLGAYFPALDVIVLLRPFYESLAHKDSYVGQYIPAHEIGHAYECSIRDPEIDARRKFLASLLAGVAAFAATGVTAHEVSNRSDITDPKKWEAMDIPPWIMAIAAGRKSYSGVNNIAGKVIERHAEFAADKHAGTIIGVENAVNGIFEQMMKSSLGIERQLLAKQYVEFGEKLQQALSKTSPDTSLTETEKEYLFILYYAKKTALPLNAPRYLLGDLYPTHEERIVRLSSDDASPEGQRRKALLEQLNSNEPSIRR